MSSLHELYMERAYYRLEAVKYGQAYPVIEVMTKEVFKNLMSTTVTSRVNYTDNVFDAESKNVSK